MPRAALTASGDGREGSRTVWAWLVTSTVRLAACSAGTDREEVVRSCDSAKRWLGLDEQAVGRCLHDAAFRDGLRVRVHERFAEHRTKTHNEGRVVLWLRGTPATAFTRITRPPELPVSSLGHDEKHIGERYVVRAQVSTEGGEQSSVFLSGLGDETHVMVGADALNAYQRDFLAKHCWLVPTPTMCEGDVYLEIRRDVAGLFVTAQLVGAGFTEADQAAVVAYTRRLQATPPPPPKQRPSSWLDYLLPGKPFVAPSP